MRMTAIGHVIDHNGNKEKRMSWTLQVCRRRGAGGAHGGRGQGHMTRLVRTKNRNMLYPSCRFAEDVELEVRMAAVGNAIDQIGLGPAGYPTFLCFQARRLPCAAPPGLPGAWDTNGDMH